MYYYCKVICPLMVCLCCLIYATSSKVNTPIEIRLVDGRYPNEGRLEVRLTGSHKTFGSYCSNVSPVSVAGRLVCKRLGFPALLSSTSNAQFGTATGPIWLQEISCYGAETLDECSVTKWIPSYTVCDHRFDVGITCFNGNVRLIGGSNEHEGIVELHAGGDEWISMATFDEMQIHPHVLSDWICSYLGYQFSIGATDKPPNNSSSRTLCKYSVCPINHRGSSLNFFDCLDEGTPAFCPRDWNGTVVGVMCAPESNVVPPTTALEFRLATTTNESNIGVMEGRYNGSSWKTICVQVLHNWQVRTKADSACRQLGWPWAATFELIHHSDSPSGYIGSGDDLIMRELFLGNPRTVRWTTGDNACRMLDYELVFVECEKGITLFGQMIFPCPDQSCRGRCGSPGTQTMCGCDTACSECNDCCYDFNQHCFPQKINTTQENNSRLASSTCQLIDGSRALVIDGCPNDWNNTVVTQQCVNDSLEGPIRYAIFGKESFFQNEFCAECNDFTADDVGSSSYPSFVADVYSVDSDECSLNVTTEIQLGCRLYKSTVFYDNTKYKNHFCAYCNGVNISSGFGSCDIMRNSLLPSHGEILFDRLVQLSFPVIPVNLLSLEQIHCYNNETHLRIHSQGVNSANDTKRVDLDIFGKLTNDVVRCYLHTLGWQNIQLTWPFFASFYANNMTSNLTVDGTYTLTTQNLTNTIEFEELLYQTLAVPSNIEESTRYWVAQCGVEKVDFVEVCKTSIASVQSPCTVNVYNIDISTLRVFNINDVQIAYIGGGQLIEAISISVTRTVNYRIKHTSEHDKNSSTVVCGNKADITDCLTPLIEETKPGTSADGHPQIIYKRKEFQQDDVTYLPDGRILICSEFFATLGEPFISFSDPLTVLNTVGYSLSIAALLATFSNYIFFAVLRNVPGGATMSLTAALFFAQLLSLTVLDKAKNQAFCVAMAALIHFFWLSTFCWMNALVFDLNRTFASQRVSNPNKQKFFLAYCLFGWGVPLVIVSALLVIHATIGEDIGFQYGGEKSCWLVGKYAVLVAFGAPLVVSLIVNVVFFVLTVHSVHASLKAAAMVRKNRAKETTFELLIYLKISSVIGFTWIFGCLGTFFNHEAVWYLFVITNSLQGVFIFTSFGCNARIRGLWQDKLGIKQKKKKKTTTKPVSSPDAANSSSVTRVTVVSSNESLSLKDLSVNISNP